MRVPLVRALLLLAAASPPCAAATLFDDLGGSDGVARIVADSMSLWLADPRIRRTFADTNTERLKGRIVEQLCQLAGGGCAYRGRDMAAAHKGLHLDTRQFDAMAEDMEIAMERLDVSFWTQDRLIALIAPMRRDVVTR
jgi:hemoglobin